MTSLTIQPFTPPDQSAAKSLILAGLAERWGQLDPSLNPDLDDIATQYAKAIFLVAYQDSLLVGTGALVDEDERTGRVTRMSVAPTHRRQGLGTQILDKLIQHGTKKGFVRIVLETTPTWHSAITFYERYGFRTTHLADGDRHFELLL